MSVNTARLSYWGEVAREAFQEGDVLAWRKHRGRINPDVGLWWDEEGLCSACGPSERNPEDRSEVVFLDHCHFTSLARGWLCRSCNVHEGKNDDGVWRLWRRTAPMLAVGERWFYGLEWRALVDPDGRRPFTAIELLTLPMDHLLEVIEAHRQQRVLRSSALMADRTSRLFGGRS